MPALKTLESGEMDVMSDAVMLTISGTVAAGVCGPAAEAAAASIICSTVGVVVVVVVVVVGIDAGAGSMA